MIFGMIHANWFQRHMLQGANAYVLELLNALVTLKVLLSFSLLVQSLREC